MKGDETILRVNKLADRPASEFEQLIKIGCREGALDYFRDNLAFRFRPLSLRNLREQVGFIFLELFRHAVQCGGNGAEFITAGASHSRAQIALRQPSGEDHALVGSARDAARYQKGQKHSQQNRDGDGDENNSLICPARLQHLVSTRVGSLERPSAKLAE